ncbi:DedA family protein [Paenibacillus abyssi]|uniref:Alkaline phosphatase n=2 Tax=Paenibacillus abyssi TaxID=1340531 RepID=A0A917D019_9BACL|nr:DedA family protein [Paenibacillus abyssi]GGG04373.1 alkaline phosphatase [Paenibacillus abyssi]
MIQHAVLQFITRFGYAGLFGSMMLGMIGLPLPDELLMTFAGYLVFKGEMLYGMTLLVSSLGAIFGVSFSYFAGKKLGLPLLEKYGNKLFLTPEKLMKSEKWFQRFGKIAVTIGFFIPGVRHFTALSAGINKWSYRTFLIYAIPGGIAWAVTFVTIGWYLGEKWNLYIENVHNYMLYIVAAVLALIVIWRILLKRKST